jgi:ribosomal-protein-alanine N-acetyltransferase
MAFLRAATPTENPVIAGEGIYLRTPSLADYSGWAELRAKSRAFLTPWEPTWPADDLTRTAFRRRVRRYHNEIREDHAYPFFIIGQADHKLLGGITLSNVTRGMTQMATLGYWMGEPYAGQGVMTAAVRAIAPFAFGSLHLHRTSSSRCLPTIPCADRPLAIAVPNESFSMFTPDFAGL